MDASYTDAEIGQPVERDALGWSPALNGQSVWQEFIFEVSPEDTDRLELTANLSRLTESVKADWVFQVNLADMIPEEKAEADEEDEDMGSHISYNAGRFLTDEPSGKPFSQR